MKNKNFKLPTFISLGNEEFSFHNEFIKMKKHYENLIIQCIAIDLHKLVESFPDNENFKIYGFKNSHWIVFSEEKELKDSLSLINNYLGNDDINNIVFPQLNKFFTELGMQNQINIDSESLMIKLDKTIINSFLSFAYKENFIDIQKEILGKKIPFSSNKSKLKI